MSSSSSPAMFDGFEHMEAVVLCQVGDACIQGANKVADASFMCLRPQHLPHPLRAGVAAAQEYAHSPSAEALVGQDSGQGGGGGGLYDDFQVAEDQPHGFEDRLVGDGEDVRGPAGS